MATNFFQYQAEAKRHTRLLIGLFIVAVVLTILAIDALVFIGLSLFTQTAHANGVTQLMSLSELFSLANIEHHQVTILIASVVTLGVILAAGLSRTSALRFGGGSVARDFGGHLVDINTQDPLLKRYVNIVEEMSIASGIPAPEIYLIENENAINAFVAGYTPSDAALAITRGSLENLSREELQGVIAHEFAHLHNGDMRINTKLIGWLFGISFIALIGYCVMSSLRYARHGRRNNSNGNDNGNGVIMVIMLFSIGLVAIGTIGHFFSKLIQSAISRQREYLADASAVQFTRNPQGIGGVLKKIYVNDHHSHLLQNSEEVGHMLFGEGKTHFIFATHPPLDKRIARVDPQFTLDHLDEVGKKLEKDRLNNLKLIATPQKKTEEKSKPNPLDALQILNTIGQPDWSQILLAAGLHEALPMELRRAAHTTSWTMAVTLYLLLKADEETLEKQLSHIQADVGQPIHEQIKYLLKEQPPLPIELKLPLFEITFSHLKQLSAESLNGLIESINHLIVADKIVDPFEYLLSRLVQKHVQTALNPRHAELHGTTNLSDVLSAVVTCYGIVAELGHLQSIEAQGAFQSALNKAGVAQTDYPRFDEWAAALDEAIEHLSRLSPDAKQQFMTGLLECVLYDGQATNTELALLRTISALINVPLSVMEGNL